MRAGGDLGKAVVFRLGVVTIEDMEKVTEGPAMSRELAHGEQCAASWSWGGGDGKDCWKRLFPLSPCFSCPTQGSRLSYRENLNPDGKAFFGSL